MKTFLHCFIFLSLLLGTDAFAKPYESMRHASVKKSQKRKNSRQLQAQKRCVPSKRKGKLAKNQCRRPRFKVVQEGRALASSETAGEFRLPEGWIYIKSIHSNESLCINIFSGQKCDPSIPFSQLIKARPPVVDPQTKEAEKPAQLVSSVDANSQEKDQENRPSTPIGLAEESDSPMVVASDDVSDDTKDELTEGNAYAWRYFTQLALENTEGQSKDQELVSVEPEAEAEPASNKKQVVTSVAGVVLEPYTKDVLVDTEFVIHKDAQAEIDRLFRDRKTGHIKPVNPRLIVKLSSICEHFQKQIHLVSGYRNQQHTTSRHYGARASDIQIPGVSIDEIRAFAQKGNHRAIGIGLYPKNGFIHIDTRDNPSYLWVQHIVPIRRGKSRRATRMGHGRAIAAKAGASSRKPARRV